MDMKESERPEVSVVGPKRDDPPERRDMLKVGVLGAIGALGAVAGYAWATKGGSGTKRYAMVIDLRKCIGCHACSVACKSENTVPLGVWRSWVKQVEQGRYPNTQRHFLPRLCNHCDKPACVEACPTGSAYKREEDGVILVHEDRCIGCKICMAACPYDARFFDPDKKTVGKCTFCLHRVLGGVVPSCVNTCQAGARIFGDLNDPTSDVAKLVAKEAVQVLKPELSTEPHVFYISADSRLMGRIREEV